MTFTYQSTYEDTSPDGTVTLSAEVCITYTVNWGCPARIRYDENDHPAEGDELEIVKIEIEDVSYPLGEPRWRDTSKEEYNTLYSWAENLYEEMLQEARETIAAKGE